MHFHIFSRPASIYKVRNCRILFQLIDRPTYCLCSFCRNVLQGETLRCYNIFGEGLTRFNSTISRKFLKAKIFWRYITYIVVLYYQSQKRGSQKVEWILPKIESSSASRNFYFYPYRKLLSTVMASFKWSQLRNYWADAYCRFHQKIVYSIFCIFQKIEKPFLEAVETTLGDRYTSNVENIYKITIKFIIETLVNGFDNANATTWKVINQITDWLWLAKRQTFREHTKYTIIIDSISYFQCSPLLISRHLCVQIKCSSWYVVNSW